MDGAAKAGDDPGMSRPPNILWIVTTQWRAQACGYAGDPNARTPAIDALAATAVNYAQAVTPHPFGPFARAAMLTGVPSPENGVVDYYDPLPADSRTIAHRLREAGYATAFFGKWHLSARDRKAPLVGEAHARALVPAAQRGGFDFWEGFESGFQLNDPWLHGSRLPEPVQFPGYQSDVLCARAGEWLARGDPWFCVVSLEPPHPPYEAPSAGISGPAESSLNLRPNVPVAAEARARRELAGYYAQIEATDRAIGRLLRAVAAARTGVVFTSVHGDMHGAHGLFRKGWPHEESVRVPLLVRAPMPEVRTDASPVSLVDLPALSLAWAEGRSWAPTGDPARIGMPSVVALPHQCDRVWRGTRSAQRKLILKADGSPWLYFDLERDPYERENLVDRPAFAEEIARWRAQIGG
jgi:arylsulfatase A-like enzyme